MIPLLLLLNCRHPVLSGDSMLTVTDYGDLLVINGTTVSFGCSSGLMLVGVKSTTCRENGDWEPDPGRIVCAQYFV